MSVFFKIVSIIKGTTVDGPGFRTSIYIAGCRHHCEGCHNPQTWDENNGTDYSLGELLSIIREEDFDVTLTGGDPLYNPEKTRILINAIKNENKNVWVYTGFTWEEIIADKLLSECIRNADVVVDGKFINSLRSIDIPFRGSSNQRLIDVRKSLDSRETIEYQR